MKKLIALTVTFAIAVMMLAGCGSNSSTGAQTGVKLGLGHKVDVSKSVDATADKAGQAQVNTVMAAVAVDANGKILAVKIDNAQIKVDFDAAGKIKTDLKAEQKTKVELGADYGMIKGSSIKKEWFEQIAELEKWMTGKTVEQVKAIKTVKKDDAHPAVPAEEDLKTKVTVSVEEYVEAVEEAVKNAQPVSGAFAKLGLGHEVSIDKSVDATVDKAGQAQVNTVMSATAFDANGKILGTKIDNAQTKVDFDAAGKIKTDLKAEQKTKVELGADYGMIKGSSIKKEWFEQIAELEKWMTGKTAEEVKAIKTVKKDDAHPAVPAEEDLKTKVTVSVEEYTAAVEEAYKNAK